MTSPGSLRGAKDAILTYMFSTPTSPVPTFIIHTTSVSPAVTICLELSWSQGTEL